MLQYSLAQAQQSQSSLVRENTLLQWVRLVVQIALAGEGPELLQKQEHFTRKLSAESPLSLVGGSLQQSKRGDRLNQKGLFCSNRPRVSKATAAFESAANVRAEMPKIWTLLTRLSGLRQMHREGRHPPTQLLEVDRSCTIWLKGFVSVLPYSSCKMVGIPREKPVKPTTIVENVMRGLMWPSSQSVLHAFKPGLLKLTSRARRKCHDEQSQEEDINDASVCGSLWSPKIGDSRVNHTAEVAKKERCERFNELVVRL